MPFPKPSESELHSRYDYYPCSNCGERVAHSKKYMQPLHSHGRSQKCKLAGEKRRKLQPRKPT